MREERTASRQEDRNNRTKGKKEGEKLLWGEAQGRSGARKKEGATKQSLFGPKKDR